MSPQRKGKQSASSSLQYDLLTLRDVERKRTQLRELGRKRKAVLASEMKGLLRYPAAFDVEDGSHHDGTPHVILNNAGQARELGFQFKELSRFRLFLQETLRIPDGRPPFYVIRYSYALVDADTGQRLFRFEYHPDLPEIGKEQKWSLIHHFHFGDEPSSEAESDDWNERLARLPLHKLHFPLWPFLSEPDENPHNVLPRVLEWCKDELRRIDTKPSARPGSSK